MPSTVQAPPTRPSDAGVPVIHDTRGWRVRRAFTLAVFSEPDGAEYVEAHPFEQADVIREFKDLGPLRLRRYENSSRIRNQQRARRRAEREQQARRAARKSVRRKAA